jgi:hypothetical protein
MKKMVALGILVTVVLGWVSLSYKNQNVPADAVVLAPSSQMGWPFIYSQVGVRGVCNGLLDGGIDNNVNPACDPTVIHNYYALAGDLAFCVLAGSLTSFIAYRLSRIHR